MTQIFGDADLQAMIDGAGGEEVTFGLQTLNCLVEERDVEAERLEGGTAASRVKTATYRTNSVFIQVKEGSTLIIEGEGPTSYRVMRIEQLDDGALRRAWLVKG